MDKHMRGTIKVRHPVLWYQLLLIFALSDCAPAKLVGFRTSDLAVNFIRNPFLGRLSCISVSSSSLKLVKKQQYQAAECEGDRDWRWQPPA